MNKHSNPRPASGSTCGRRSRVVAGALTVALLPGAALLASGAARADVDTFTLRQPLSNATVRESVPIRVPRNLLAQSSYASVTIDGSFVGAQAIPASGDVVYVWHTKGVAASTADASAPPIADGKHTIVVDLFDKASNEFAEATSTVRVANHISTLPDGVHLAYQWRANENQVYTLVDTLKNADSGTTLQYVNLRFNRDVEDASNAQYLLRDHVAPGGTISGGPESAGTSLGSLYSLASKYWTVNRYGAVVVDNQPFEAGDHFGFPVAEFPDRRLGVGDVWQTRMLVSLPWSSEHLTPVHGQAKLDSFEWQSGYPTAKIVETYSGPARFSVGGTPVDASDVQVTRTVWFAYEAGMVVRMDTNLTVNSPLGSAQLAALQAPSSAAPATGERDGRPRYGYLGGAPGGYPGGPAYGPPTGYPGAPAYGPPTGYPGAPGPYGYPGAQGNPNAAAAGSKLTSTESITLTAVTST